MVCLCTKGFTVRNNFSVHALEALLQYMSVNLLGSRSEFQLCAHPAFHSYKPNCQSTSDIEHVYSSFPTGTTRDTSNSILALLLKGVDWKRSQLPIQNIFITQNGSSHIKLTYLTH